MNNHRSPLPLRMKGIKCYDMQAGTGSVPVLYHIEVYEMYEILKKRN